MSSALAFGAPGVYPAPDVRPRVIQGERMDTCAFVGITPRGPSRVPVEPEDADSRGIYVERFRRRRSCAVLVESWDQYRHLYGEYQGPGLLPYAVANFFDQGGKRAYIVRVVHNYQSDEDFDGVASLTLSTVHSTHPVLLDAKSEGSWGNGLSASFRFQRKVVEFDAAESTAGLLTLYDRQSIEPGSLLLLKNESNLMVRFVDRVSLNGSSRSARSVWQVSLEGPSLSTLPLEVFEITGDLRVRENSTAFSERFTSLGLSRSHSRFVARELYKKSVLVNPNEIWLDARITPLALSQIDGSPRPSMETRHFQFTGGVDRYEDIVHEDFFDSRWVLSDPDSGNGIHAITHLADVSMLVTPDLYVAQPLPEPFEDGSASTLPRSDFVRCDPNQATPVQPQIQVQSLPGLVLNPAVASELTRIIQLQTRVVGLADTLREFIVLLDVPPGLRAEEVRRWRSKFRSEFAAAYWPWLSVATLDDNRDALIALNPASVAAGLVARQELVHGLAHGPANLLASSIVAVDRPISPLLHNEFHPLGINVFMQEQPGVRLTGARTLSLHSFWRQISVVRLMTMLRRALYNQMQWVVFEPNTPKLWADLQFKLEAFLRQLFIAGAFRGNFETEAYFVRCDEQLNPTRIVDAGKLIVEIGVAPAEPMEFIVIRITREGDGTLTVEQ